MGRRVDPCKPKPHQGSCWFLETAGSSVGETVMAVVGVNDFDVSGCDPLSLQWCIPWGFEVTVLSGSLNDGNKNGAAVVNSAAKHRKPSC